MTVASVAPVRNTWKRRPFTTTASLAHAQRRNAISRTVAERMIDERFVTTGGSLGWILVAAAQAINSTPATKGRSSSCVWEDFKVCGRRLLSMAITSSVRSSDAKR